MDTTEKTTPTPISDTNTESSVFSANPNLWIILLVLFILTVIGINILSVTGNLLEELSKMFGPTLVQVTSMFGYSTGELINNTADLAADTAKLGVDIAEGTVKDVGSLLKNASEGGMDHKQKADLEKLLSNPKCPSSNCPKLECPKQDHKEPNPTKSGDSVQQSIASQKPKAGWCLVGDYDGTRGCVELDEHEKCMSGQIFPSQKMCLNPTYTQNLP